MNPYIHEPESCKICGHPNASRRYNCIACNACRVFFDRYHANNLAFSCDASGSCEITYKRQRMNCAACRLKKCLDSKMFKTESRKNIIGTLNLTRGTYAPIKKLTEIYGGIMNSGFKIIGHLKDCQSVTEWVDRLAHFDREILAIGGKSPSSTKANTTMTLTDFIMYPGSCMDRSTASFDHLASTSPSIPYKLKESICRLFVASAECMTIIEEYHLLPPVDRIRLLQQNAFMLSNYVLGFREFTGVGWDANASLQYMTRFKMADGVAHLWNRVVTIWSSSSYFKCVSLLKETQPTMNEWLIMRIWSLFRPTVSMSSDGHAIAIQIRLKLANCLGEYMREIYPNLSKEQIHMRLRKMMEIELYMKEYDIEVYNILLAITLQHSSGWSTPLLHDIFIRKY